MTGSEPRLLEGKRILITGVLTNRSIAFSVARRAQEHGAEILLTSFGRVRRLTERSALGLPDPPEVLELDVSRAEDFTALGEELERRWGVVDGAVHSVAFAPADALDGNFLHTPVESARLAFEVSAYSYKALAECVFPLFPKDSGGRAGIVGMDFDATVSWPRYDWMGVSKAALEAVNRYLARYLGPAGARANLVAAGLLETTATAAFGAGWARWADEYHNRAPLGWDTGDHSQVADVVCFLLSDLARGITGEILHADGGLHAMSGGVEPVDAQGRPDQAAFDRTGVAAGGNGAPPRSTAQVDA
jgi:enoyl ACP reductase